MERLRDPALHVVLAQLVYEPVVDSPLLKNVNCVGSLKVAFSPEVAASPTEGVENLDCVDWLAVGHVKSSKCLRQNHCGWRGHPTATKARREPHTEQG
jgi:hypothetical protein